MKKKSFLPFVILLVLLFLFCSCAPGHGDTGEYVSSDTTETQKSGDTTDTSENVATLTLAEDLKREPTDENTLRFLVFSDLHYKRFMYVATTDDVDKVLKRADENSVDFVIQLGDFCNEFSKSPELFGTYLNNKYGLPAYGVCGNHDMEGPLNTVDFIRTKLCNRTVNFGRSKNGKGTAYWYTDIKNFRIIGLDTNYSYSTATQSWERNKANTSHAPKENEKGNSLGPDQLSWLRARIKEASEKNMKVLVFSHVSFSDSWSRSPDADAVRKIFADYEGTVLLASNGHSHTDHFKTIGKTVYFDVNSVRNGYWYSQSTHHYSNTHTYKYYNYVDGVVSGDPVTIPLTTLSQAKNTWFFTEPLSAVVTVSEDGTVKVEGAVTRWMYDILPDSKKDGTKPMIGYYVYDGKEVK
ncbi:MAG: hypothetical protein E7601_02480 [Ruminococcaceae bacterium]|nr:hypothetical protein [Oscillospiraceae bacterium]